MREGGGQQVAKWKRRCCLTHVGLICDRPEVQPKLPQFIVGNERTLPAKQMGVLQRSCPPNVTLVRQKSAWSNAALTGRIVRALAVAVRSYEARLGRLQIVLILDAARIHFTPLALRAYKAAGVWVVIAPAKLTWLIQPLDTHAFARYKGRLQNAYQSARMASSGADGDVNIAEFLPCVYTAIRCVLQGNRWIVAFERDGYGARQTALSNTVKRRLELQGPLDIPSERPSHAQVRVCLPRNANVSTASLWSLFVDPVARAAPLVLPRMRGSAALGPLEGIAARAAGGEGASGSGRAADTGAACVFGRTRSQTLRLKCGEHVRAPLRAVLRD